MIRRAMMSLLPCGPLLAGLLLATPARAQDDDSRAAIQSQNQLDEQRHDAQTRDQSAGDQSSGDPSARDQSGQDGGTAGDSQPAPRRDSPESVGSATDMMPQLLDRVSRLEDQVRSLSGHVDELNNELQQQHADLTKQIGDLAFRVQTLEGGKPADAAAPPLAGSLPPRLPAAPVAAGPRPIAPPTLQQGYAALSRRDYDTAEAAARQALAARSPHAYDAQFLLAQSLSGQRSYQQAALAYDDTYTKSRRGPHAQDALVGLAGSLAALGEKPAACATLDKLHAEFPGARPDIRGSAAGISRRAACR